MAVEKKSASSSAMPARNANAAAEAVALMVFVLLLVAFLILKEPPLTCMRGVEAAFDWQGSVRRIWKTSIESA
jgi:hypothetical protein